MTAGSLRFISSAGIVLCLLHPPVTGAQPAPRHLRVSENRRYLVREDGRHFFFLAEAGWELFHRTTREEADRYLQNRAEKEFTVIQAVALAEIDGLHAPNSYGHVPLIDDDPTRPNLQDGPDNDYWDHVDYCIKKANSMGIVIALVPSWGDKWHKKWGIGPEIFTPDNAEIFGRWIGHRYRDTSIIWILGGDRPIETPLHREIVDRMAAGIAAGDGGAHLRTYHPSGGDGGSSKHFHDAPWLDFNMRQNGHGAAYPGKYDQTRADYNRQPVKPVLDDEPVYEDHPIAFKPRDNGHSVVADVRRAQYWGLFEGGFGLTYGHHSIWQFWTPERSPINQPLVSWQKALDQPGSSQMRHTRALLESRPFLTRIPDDSILVPDRVSTSVPGAGLYRFAATRDESGSFAMVYAPIGREFTVRMDAITGLWVVAWWFNPRNGEATRLGEFENNSNRTFLPPTPGETLDWVLVLDDARQGFPRPGAPFQQPAPK